MCYKNINICSEKIIRLFIMAIACVVAFINCKYYYQMAIYPHADAQWVTRTWLSNYQAGIIKRGLVGEFFYFLPVSWDQMLKAAYMQHAVSKLYRIVPNFLSYIFFDVSVSRHTWRL